jgi:hypothetical protein
MEARETPLRFMLALDRSKQHAEARAIEAELAAEARHEAGVLKAQ